MFSKPFDALAIHDNYMKHILSDIIETVEKSLLEPPPKAPSGDIYTTLSFDDGTWVKIQEADSQGINDLLHAETRMLFQSGAANTIEVKHALSDLFKTHAIDATWGQSSIDPPSEPPSIPESSEPAATVQAHPLS